MGIKNELKILVFIKKSKLLKNGEAPIFIRVTYKLKRVEFGIKESIDPKYWDKQLEYAKVDYKESAKINLLIEQYINRIETIKQILEIDGYEVSSQLIKEKFLGKNQIEEQLLRFL